MGGLSLQLAGEQAKAVQILTGVTPICTVTRLDSTVDWKVNCGLESSQSGTWTAVVAGPPEHRYLFSVPGVSSLKLTAGKSVTTQLSRNVCPTDAALYHSGQWHRYTLAVGSCEVPWPQAVLSDEVPVWLAFPDGPPVSGNLVKAPAVAAPTPPQMHCPSDPQKRRIVRGGGKDPYGAAVGPDEPYQLCVVLGNGTSQSTLYDPGDPFPQSKGTGQRPIVPYLLPSRWVEVFVDSGGKPFVVNGYGDIGIGSDEVEQGERGTSALGAGAQGSILLAPRVPGPFVVEIEELGQAAPNTTALTKIRSHKIEMLTLRGYASAIRFGLGVGHSAQLKNYEKATIANQSVVVEGPAPNVLPELMVGFSPFFERYGRVYPPGRGFRPRMAPYFGTSLYAFTAATDPTSWLSAAWVGIDVELARSFSVVPLIGGRRTERLADGFEVGSLAPTTEFTRLAFVPAWGIAVNVSPVYFRAVRNQLTNSSFGNVAP